MTSGFAFSLPTAVQIAAIPGLEIGQGFTCLFTNYSNQYKAILRHEPAYGSNNTDDESNGGRIRFIGFKQGETISDGAVSNATTKYKGIEIDKKRSIRLTFILMDPRQDISNTSNPIKEQVSSRDIPQQVRVMWETDAILDIL